MASGDKVEVQLADGDWHEGTVEHTIRSESFTHALVRLKGGKMCMCRSEKCIRKLKP